jgi:hypothetical protein
MCPGLVRRVVSVVALAAGVAACTDRLPDQDLRIVEAVPVERLSVALLWQDFETSRAQAESNYNGKAVVIIGEATGAGTDAPGDRYVYFKRTDTGGIRANLLDERASAVLAAVKDAPRVTLKCFCEGVSGVDVVLKSCIAEP